MHSLEAVPDMLLRGAPLERLEARNLEAEGVLEQALKARSFQREVIAVVGDRLVADFMANLAFNLRQHGFEHWILISADRIGCTRLERLRLPCLWSSRLEVLDPAKKRLVAEGIDTPHGADMSLARSFALRERALRLQSGRAWVARESVNLGYNVLVLEPEFSLRSDPYSVLKLPDKSGSPPQASLFLTPDSCDFRPGGRCCSPKWAGEYSSQVFPCVSSSLVYASTATGGPNADRVAIAALLERWEHNVELELSNLHRDAGKWNLLEAEVKRDLTAPLNWAVLNVTQEALGKPLPSEMPASSKSPIHLQGDATLAVGNPLEWSSLRVPDEWLLRHTDSRAYGRLVGAHLAGDHFLRSKRFKMRAFGWWHYESGRASESGFHYDSSTYFMGLVPEAEQGMKELPAAAWRLAASRLADLATAVGFTAVLPEVGCANLPGRHWMEREVVVSGYKPLRCYFNTGELWSRPEHHSGSAPVKCGDRQLLHPAARHDPHFLSRISLRNQTLDIGSLLMRQGGEDVVALNELLDAVKRLEAKPGHLILVRPPRLNQELPRVTGLDRMVQHRVDQFQAACPIAAPSEAMLI